MTESSEQPPADPRSPRRHLLVAAGVAVLVLALLRILVVETFTVTSDSMQPTLEHGDRLVVLKTTRIDHGDLVVFDGTHLLGPAPAGGNRAGDALARLLGADAATAYVKRVIGLPGDHVACCDDDGRLTRNGAPLAEPYLTGPTDQTIFEVTVPKDRYWVLGDNRADSADSRSALGRPGGGMLRSSAVIGEVVWRYWPTGRVGAPGRAPHTTAVSGMGDTSGSSLSTPEREESVP